MEHIFSKHCLDQLITRNISHDTVKAVLTNPFQIIAEDDYTIYQSIVSFESKAYLIRVFVNPDTHPPKVITVYKTSKINKYYAGEV